MRDPRERDLVWPVLGIDERRLYQTQAPYTTVAARNVRPDESILQRERGGSRPGFVKAFSENIAASPTLLADTLVFVAANGTHTNLFCTAAGGTFKKGTTSLAAPTAALTLSTSGIIATASKAHRLYMTDRDSPRVNGTDGVTSLGTDGRPLFDSASGGLSGVVVANESLVVESKGNGVSEVQSITIGGAPSGGTFTVTFRGETCTVAHNASASVLAQQLISLNSIGYSVEDGAGNVAVAGTAPYAITFQNKLKHQPIELLVTDPAGLTGGGTYTAAVASTTPGSEGDARLGSYRVLSVTSDTRIQLIESPDQTNATSGIKFRVQRSPKYYDGLENKMFAWYAKPGKGSVPVGSPFLVNWRGRAVMIDDKTPHILRMSRQDDWHDWLDTLDHEDPARPIDLSATEAGEIGDPIVAVIEWSDDCLIVFCSTSCWVIRGDPAEAGVLDRLHPEIGIVGANAWTFVANNMLMWLSFDGIYAMAGRCGGEPFSISRERLPNRLLNIDTSTVTPIMGSDMRDRCAHLYLSTASGTPETHYFIDLRNTFTGDKPHVAFYETSFADANHTPTVIHQRRNHTDDKSWCYHGCRDGYIRVFSGTENQDDGGSEIQSYIDYGPIPLTVRGNFNGILLEMDSVLGKDSGDVSWELYLADDPEECATKTIPDLTGIWRGGHVKGLQPRDAPHRSGSWMRIRIKNGETGDRWAMEKIRTYTATLGDRRV
jgi:hypothetical protein